MGRDILTANILAFWDLWCMKLKLHMYVRQIQLHFSSNWQNDHLYSWADILLVIIFITI